MGKGYEKKTCNLILVFDDQLDSGSVAFDGSGIYFFQRMNTELSVANKAEHDYGIYNFISFC